MWEGEKKPTLICALLRCAARYMSWALRGRFRPPGSTPLPSRPMETQRDIVFQTSVRYSRMPSPSLS